MRIKDPLRMNDWNIYRFLGVVLALQAAALLVLWLRSEAIDLPVAGQAVLLVYLAFVPGMLILRACRIHNLGSITSPLFAVGLSLMALMATGVLLDMFLPLLGYSHPLTLFPLAVAITALVLALCVISYVRDRDFECDAYLDTGTFLSPQALLLMLIPFLAIFGAFLMNVSGNNILLLAMIAIIGVIVLLAGFNILITRELYPLAILVIALALLLHNSLISDNLIGWDIHQEKFMADTVIGNGYWQVSMDYIINSMLSIVILAPIFSIFLNMDVTWVYKIIFPLIFALVPLALYQAYRKQSDDKMAFMAIVFFVSLVVFFTEMLQLARQEIAELFLALIILLIMDRSMEKSRWSFLFLVFCAGLVMSHYGLTVIFIGTIIAAWLLVYIAGKLLKGSRKNMNRRLTYLAVLGLIVICAVWYIYTSSSNPLHTVVDVSREIEGPLTATIYSYVAPQAVTNGTAVTGPTVTEPVNLIATAGSVSVLHKMYLYLMLVSQVVMGFGIVTALLSKGRMKIQPEFYALAIVNLAMLVMALFLPNFATALNTTRLYQIALLILAPFFVMGWVNLFRGLGILTRRSASGTVSVALTLLSIFLVLYLIFNTGLIFQVAKDVPMSYSLDTQGANVSYTVYNNMERTGAEWMIDAQEDIAVSQNMSYVPPVFSDTYRMLFLQDWNTSRSYQLSLAPEMTPQGSYIYLGTYNVVDDLAVEILPYEQRSVALVDLKGLKNTRNRIYANGGSEIYL